ncbi:MAG: signal peptidase [Planctomycetaceae bacterium]|nr:signal peptidase [Planctomycetaceae bacterium]
MPDYVVRYGSMRILRTFGCSGKNSYRRSQQVIVRTDRGLEAGEVLCEAKEEQTEKPDPPREGQILREMTAEDRNEVARIHHQEEAEFEVCQRCIAELGLEMQLVDIEHIFGGERIVVYYLADGRVDFRELVKKLAGEFQTRIEMRQIGVRDEAKLMADFGDCGKAVCCNTHLVSMPPVSMKMAKLQKATLDPTKISGRCGRLKCCLRYEYETYEEGLAEMPAIGALVQTPEGQARVVGQEILAGQVLVETEDRVRKLVNLGDVSVRSPEERSKSKRAKQPPQSP